TTQRLPLRSYAQPTVIGSDAYIDGTTLSVGNVQQLLQPVLYGGDWGEGARYALTSTPSDTTVGQASYLVPASGAYGGGFGSALGASNTLIQVGSSGVYQHVLTSAELATSSPFQNLKITAPSTRTFRVVNWFEI